MAEATLNGYLDDDTGETCDCGFEWGETPALGNTTPTQSCTTGTAFSFVLTGLTPGETYYFRAFATNSAGTGYGDILSFTVRTVSVMTLPATNITEHTAQLNGIIINDGGEAGNVRFEWGGSTAYGNQTPWQGSFSTGDEFNDALDRLAEGASFHFRAVFLNSLGVFYGNDQVFSTLVSLGPVVLIEDELAYMLEVA